MAAGHGLSDAELAAVVAPNDKWKHAARDDAWVRSHEALRADMSDFASALATLQKQTSPLTAWQVCGAADFSRCMHLHGSFFG